MLKTDNNLKLVLMALVVGLSSFSVAFSQQEEITLTTYYSSPYGSYKELRANQMSVGVAYTTGSAPVTVIPTDSVIISRNMGIGISAPTEELSPASLTNVGNLDVRDVWVRKANNWASLLSGTSNYIYEEGREEGMGGWWDPGGPGDPGSGGTGGHNNPWCSSNPNCHYNQNRYDLTAINTSGTYDLPEPRLCIFGGVRRAHNYNIDWTSARVSTNLPEAPNGNWVLEVYNNAINQNNPSRVCTSSGCTICDRGTAPGTKCEGFPDHWFRAKVTCFY